MLSKYNIIDYDTNRARSISLQQYANTWLDLNKLSHTSVLEIYKECIDKELRQCSYTDDYVMLQNRVLNAVRLFIEENIR